MPLQNRVTPEGEIVAHASRGLMMGNRGGALHDENKSLARRRWITKQWICCRLDFKGRHREVMAPRRYTELFFLDEATALAAGHRPCFECRRSDARRFAALWATGSRDRPTAPEMDDVLHRERVDKAGRKVTHAVPFADLPFGAFIRIDGRPHLVLGSRLGAWTHGGYAAVRDRPSEGKAEALTPPSILAVLAAGYRPMVHPSASIAM